MALAQDAEGLDNLQRLSSARLPRPATPPAGPASRWTRSAAHAGGLILLTGGTTGPLGRLLAEGRRDAGGGAAARSLRESSPDRLAVELHRHGLPVETRGRARRCWRLADAAGLPIVATNDVYFADAGDARGA